MIKQDTKKLILDFIAIHQGVKAHDIIINFSLNAAGIFRHLKNLCASHSIYKMGRPPKVTYFAYNNMPADNFLKQQINWAMSGGQQFLLPDSLCATRDIFQARLERSAKSLIELTNENLAYLLIAVAGEIGNNAFDHNLGNWRDVMGLNFAFNLSEKEILLADRGQGMLKTIQNVKPDVMDDATALRVAFTETISGRYPEQRGNGLKFVKKIVEENNLYLEFYSGRAVCIIDSNGLKIDGSRHIIPGTLALIKF